MTPSAADTGKIGPHEGQEYALMRGGQKPLALFCDVVGHTDYFPEAEFQHLVTDGHVIMREEFYTHAQKGITARCLFYALKDQAWRIDAAHAIQKATLTGERSAHETDDITLGQLLGYTEADIATFLNRVRTQRTKG